MKSFSFFDVRFVRLIFSVILLLLLSASFPVFSIIPEKMIVVVITSYNNKTWYKKNLDTLFKQEYTNYRVIYIDDCSTDNTGNLVEEFVREQQQEKRFTLIRNKTNQRSLKNLYNAIISCDDDDIIITYDGDDWLSNNKVLQTINKSYQSDKVWLTFGSFVTYPDGVVNHLSKPYSKKVIKKNLFRKHKHPSHLKTFYAWLFKKINKIDLMYDGSFYMVAGDLAIMYPMIEMAGERHKCIKEITYVYNQANLINNDKTNGSLQTLMGSHIRGLKRYRRLKDKYSSPRYER